EHAVPPGPPRRERTPVLDRSAETVHENERRTVSADRVAKPRSAPFDLAFVESLQAGFAVRHQRGIFFGQWILLQGGRSDVRKHDKRGCDLTRQRIARGGFFRSRGRRAQQMANHLTPEELSKELGLDRQEVIRVCVEEGVPIYQGKIDKYLFQAQLQALSAQQPAA